MDAEGAGIYGSQSRDDFDNDDVEQVLLSFPLPSFLNCIVNLHFFILNIIAISLSHMSNWTMINLD